MTKSVGILAAAALAFGVSTAAKAESLTVDQAMARIERLNQVNYRIALALNESLENPEQLDRSVTLIDAGIDKLRAQKTLAQKFAREIEGSKQLLEDIDAEIELWQAMRAHVRPKTKRP